MDINLNAEQKEAVEFRSGPLLIIAGAGTGKTTVVTERIKYLIGKGLANPSQILALTFTEKAAREMETRVDVAMPYGYTNMWISTFHSFCDRVLRDSALNIGFDPKYKLMSEAECLQLIRKNIFKFNLNYFRPLGNPNKFISGVLKHFSRLQDEDVTPQDYLEWVSKTRRQKKSKRAKEEKTEIAKWTELANAYKTYDELKVKEGLMDFGDLITKTLKLFRDRPNILSQYQKQFKYILVDEFQDTNYAQNELAILLAAKGKNITVCGDDDQSIYRFRGAAVSNIVQFRNNFPKAKIVVLTKNYRSTQEILDRAYDLIQGNNPDRLEVVEKVNKRLIGRIKGGEKIVFIHEDRVENEAESVAKKIEMLTREGYDYKDFAVLVRANAHAEPFSRAFLRQGIPSQFLGPGRLFRQPEIIDLISYLKVLYNFEDSVALYRILSMDYFDILPRDLVIIGNYARKKYLSLYEACVKIDKVLVSKKTKEKVKQIIKIVDGHLKLVNKETAGQLLFYFLEKTNLLQKLLNPDNPGAERKALNVSKFFDKLKSYEVNHEDATVRAVVDWLELSAEIGESPLAADSDWTEVDAVNILTVHSAKGLEFPVVFLVNLVSQRFPSTERREQIPIPEDLIKEVLPLGDYHIQEERRLFYVGMTRAKKLLFLTAANYYAEGKREKKISPFIFEVLGDSTVSAEEGTRGLKQLSFLDYQKRKKEAIFEKAPFHIDYLSFSQIDTFRTCPLHYRLKYIYNVPTEISPSQSFGISIHASLRMFYENVREGHRPTEKLILNCLRQSWKSEGYLGKVHEKKFFDKGKFYLLGYLKEGFDRKLLPLAMEQRFTIPIITDGRNKRPLRIGGMIDRIDEYPDGSVEIVDYKTGATIPSPKEVDKNLQLSFYALAASMIPQPPFARDVGKIKLSLYFLDNQQKLSTKKTKDDLGKAIAEIFKVREEIENSDFECSGNILCRSCEYNLFCRVKG